MYNKECCLRCVGCRVIILDDNLNNLYNKECCSCCFGCRVIILGRQLKQLVQPRMLFLLFWLSCYIFRTTTQTTCTTKNVVPVVLVVVLYFKDDNSNNLYNKESCSCCFGCRVYFWGRQLKQRGQLSWSYKLSWYKSYCTLV